MFSVSSFEGSWTLGLPGQTNPANLGPAFGPGNRLSRRSAHVDRALRKARKLTPEAINFCGRVMGDEELDIRLRLKAAEIILLHGMPKGDAHRRHLEAIEGSAVNSLRVEFVAADGSTVSFEQANLPQIVDASMDKTVINHTALSNTAPLEPISGE